MRAPSRTEQVGIFLVFFGLGRMLRRWLERGPASGGEIPDQSGTFLTGKVNEESWEITPENRDAVLYSIQQRIGAQLPPRMIYINPN